MKRTTKVRITATRTRTVNLAVAVHRAFCRECRREVHTLTSRQAAELLETSQPQLEHLLMIGKVHALATAGESLWICKDSLLSEIDAAASGTWR